MGGIEGGISINRGSWGLRAAAVRGGSGRANGAIAGHEAFREGEFAGLHCGRLAGNETEADAKTLKGCEMRR